MDIHFCDICNESVPESDLAKGRAVRRKGHVVCVKCEFAMSGELPPRMPGAPPAAVAGPAPAPAPAGTPGTSTAPDSAAPATPSAAPEVVHPATPQPVHHRTHHPARSSTGAAVGVALATVALFLAVGGALFLFQRMELERKTTNDGLRDLRQELAHGTRVLDSRIDNRALSLDERLGEITLERGELETHIDQLYGHQRRDMEELRLELVRLTGKLGELEAKVSNVDRHERDLAKMTTQVTNLREEILRFGERMAAATQRPEPSISNQPQGAGGGIGGGEPRPEWWATLAELESDNASTRWQAVQSLGNTGDPEVAPHLFGMLSDADIFVRMATARILGDLGAMAGVPALIDALEDVEASVREASVVALRSITGQDLRFDPTANGGERAKRVKDWRDWWRKSGEELLGSGDA